MVLTVVRNVLRLTSGACVCLIIVVLLMLLPRRQRAGVRARG